MELTEILKRAANEKWAVPHFNISDLVQLKGILRACRALRSPVMIGTSEGEADFIGFYIARAFVDSAKYETEIPIFLNADHFHSFEKCKMAIDAGYDSVLIDLSKKPYIENAAVTKSVVEYRSSVGREVEIEGELGHIVTDSSKIYKEVIQVPESTLAKSEEALRFIGETGIDRLAAAVGSIHGIAANVPKIDFDRIVTFRNMIPMHIALVLHGGSGLPDEDLKKSIALGINNVHISTTIRVAYMDALRHTLAASPGETTPYKIYEPVIAAVADSVSHYIHVFGSAGKA